MTSYQYQWDGSPRRYEFFSLADTQRLNAVVLSSMHRDVLMMSVRRRFMSLLGRYMCVTKTSKHQHCTHRALDIEMTSY